ncbi:amino acid permease [Mycobacterium barrassiae]|nr:amino acid permease [Mycobacterium barrassiae]MCV7298321.1 amino acid permease [Mycobacterium barrassiae]
MTQVSPEKPGADEFCEDCGYEPELKRTLGQFQVFAISFAFISVAVGVFGTYDDVLRNAGPVGIWLWIVVAIGQTLVALVIAQFAARIPLSGSSYQWGSRLANPKVGWWFGWASFCILATGVVAINNALAQMALMPLLGMPEDEGTARIITVVLMIVEALIVIASTRLLAMINSGAVGLELSLVIILTIALFVAVAVSGKGSVSNLVSRGITEGAPNYFAIGGGLMLATVLGMTTLVGFEAAANLAEEAKDPYRTVPRAVVGSVIAASVLGLVFLISLTVAIDDMDRISRSDSPVVLILRDQLGPVTESILLTAIVFAFFGAGLVTLATCSRIVYAMARDSRFPAHGMMRRVNPRTQTPIPATILVVVLGILLMIAMPGDALLALITTGTILGPLLYGATIVLYLSVRKRLDRVEGAFDLGRFEMPVAVSALIWSAIAIFVILAPPSARVPTALVAGLFLIGGLYFFKLWTFDREILETEPGDTEMFKH